MSELADEPAPARRGEACLRRIFPLVAWLFVVCIVVQFFLVGLRVFGVEQFNTLHRDFAYTYGWLTPILVLLAVSRVGSRQALRLAVVLLVLFAVQTFLPLLAKSAPGVAAFHALNALLVAYVALRLAQMVSKVPGASGTPRR